MASFSIPSIAEQKGLRAEDHPNLSVSVIGGGPSSAYFERWLVDYFGRLLFDEDIGPEHLPRITVNIHNDSCNFGRGTFAPVPSRFDREFVSTIPAHRFDAVPRIDPNPHNALPALSFGEWCEQSGIEKRAFVKRNEFPAYLQEMLSLLDRVADMPSIGEWLTINRRVETVAAVKLKADGRFELVGVDAAGERYMTEADAVTLAVGPLRNDAFAHLKGCKGYVHDPMQLEPFIEEFDRVNPKHVTLIGGGHTTVDAISVLEKVGFRGTYDVIARSGFLAFPYSEALARDNRLKGQLLFFGEQLRRWTREFSLEMLLEQECHLAGLRGFAKAEVYWALDLNEVAQVAAAHVSRDEIRNFCAKVRRFQTSPIAPRSFEAIKALERSNRLNFLTYSAQESDICVSSWGGFTVNIRDLRGSVARAAHSDMVINGVPFHRTVPSSTGNTVGPSAQIVRNVLESQLFELTPSGTLGVDDYNQSTLVSNTFAVGAVVTDEAWSIPGFQEQIREAAWCTLMNGIAEFQRKTHVRPE